MSADEIIWQDPPDFNRGAPGRRKGTSIWQRRLAPFLDRPGQWGVIPDLREGSVCRTAFYNFRKGVMHVPDGTCVDEWEYVTRARPDGQGFDCYVRYAPKPKAVEDVA